MIKNLITLLIAGAVAVALIIVSANLSLAVFRFFASA